MLPHWDNIYANPPSHIILTPGRPVMFRGPSFIVSTMQEETTPIFKHLWYDWTQQQPGIEPRNPLGQCWVPPIIAFYEIQPNLFLMLPLIPAV